MGSTRSWAADMEDEDRTCPHGRVTKYFDKCQCDGCKRDREREESAMSATRSLEWEIYESLLKKSDKQREILIDRIKHALSYP
jgi:hypothetical protein